MQSTVICDKATAKRICQTMLPTVPGPVVDLALNASPFFGTVPPPVAQQQANDDGQPFLCRKMNSGDFGHLSIVSPKGGKHIKLAAELGFTRPEAFNFTMQCDKPGRNNR